MGNSMKYSSKTHCTEAFESSVRKQRHYCFPPADSGAIEIQKNLLSLSQGSLFWEVLLWSAGCLSKSFLTFSMVNMSLLSNADENWCFVFMYQLSTECAI